MNHPTNPNRAATTDSHISWLRSLASFLSAEHHVNVRQPHKHCAKHMLRLRCSRAAPPSPLQTASSCDGATCCLHDLITKRQMTLRHPEMQVKLACQAAVCLHHVPLPPLSVLADSTKASTKRSLMHNWRRQTLRFPAHVAATSQQRQPLRSLFQLAKQTPVVMSPRHNKIIYPCTQHVILHILWQTRSRQGTH